MGEYQVRCCCHGEMLINKLSLAISLSHYYVLLTNWSYNNISYLRMQFLSSVANTIPSGQLHVYPSAEFPLNRHMKLHSPLMFTHGFGTKTKHEKFNLRLTTEIDIRVNKCSEFNNK